MILGRCTRGRFPGPVLRLAIAFGTENTSACCPAVRMAACWRSAKHLFGTADRKRGGEGSDGTLVGRRSRSVPRGHARHRQALRALVPDPRRAADRNRDAGHHLVVSSAAVIVLLGWLLIISGVVQGLSLIGAGQVPHFWLQLISVILAVLIGFLFLRDPAQGMATITLLLIVFFMIEGISKVVFALTIRPFPNWGWVLASGLVGILLALILWANLPVTALWLVGVLLGLQLISVGAAIAYLAWQVRQS